MLLIFAFSNFASLLEKVDSLAWLRQSAARPMMREEF
jgi:hypothetical protein